MQTLAASKFKSQTIAIIEEIAKTKEPLVITKRGKPIVKIIPVDNKVQKEKPLKGTVTFIGDIFSPIDEEWEVNN